MSVLTSLITNELFVSIATIFLHYFWNKNLQKGMEKLKSKLQIEQDTVQERLNKKDKYILN